MSFQQGDDRPLDCHWQADVGIIEKAGMAMPARKGDAQAKASILACAVLERLGQNRRISYSRNRNFYGDGRYGTMGLSHRLVTQTVDAMESMGLAWHAKQEQGAHLAKVPMQSAFWASDTLMSLIGDTPLKHRGPRAHVVMRDEHDMLWELLPTTEQARRAIAENEALNNDLRQIKVDVDPAADPANWDWSAYHLRARKIRPDGTETWSIVTPTDPEVVRIYGRGRLDCHGRLYGWWQNLPKARRAELLVNGEFSIEPDFESLHPTLLYAMVGIRLDYDPYDTGVFPRQHGKLALNIGINAKRGLKGAVDALMSKDMWTESRAYTKRLVDTVAARNEPIRQFIGSDAGIRLMGHDSRMAMDVLKRCRRDGVAVLPVHDSFRCGLSNEGIVTGHMQAVLEETRVRLSSTRTMVSGQTVLQMPPERVALPGADLSAVPVETPLAEPMGTPPAEPVVSVSGVEVPLEAEPCVTPVAEPLGVPGAEPFATLPGGVRRTPVLWIAPSLVSLAREVTCGPSCTPVASRGGLSPVHADPDPSVPLPCLPALPLAVPALPPIHVSPEVLTVSHTPAPSFPASPHWTLWRPDGTGVKGHRMFLETEALALIAIGHDPFTHPGPHAGKVAPGLGNPPLTVVGHGASEYGVTTRPAGPSCTTA